MAKKYVDLGGLTRFKDNWNKVHDIKFTQLRLRIEALENENKDLKSQVEDLKDILYTLVSNPEETILKFHKMEEFLNSVANQNTLTGLMEKLKSDIEAQIPINDFGSEVDSK